MNILLVSDAPLDESDIGYKTQNIAMELLKREHTVTVISFEYKKNDRHPFNAINILFNKNAIIFEIPVYEKCHYSSTLYHNLSNENVKVIREALESAIDNITNRYKFDAVIFSHITPFLFLRKALKIPVFVMAEIDEANLINEAGLPDYIKIRYHNFSLIYSEKYSRNTIINLFKNTAIKSYRWNGCYNRSIFRPHDEKFDEILIKYNFPTGKNIILPPLNFTNNEIRFFTDIAKLFSLFKYNANFILFAGKDTTAEIADNQSIVRVIHPENHFHLAILYNNASYAIIPSEKPFLTSTIFNLVASGVKIVTKYYPFMEELNIPHFYTVKELDLISITKGIMETEHSKDITPEDIKTIKDYSIQNNFNNFLNIIEVFLHEYRTNH